MIVANVMTRNPTFVSPDMSINDAKELMLKEKIGTPEQISIVTSIPLEKILELKKKMQ